VSVTVTDNAELPGSNGLVVDPPPHPKITSADKNNKPHTARTVLFIKHTPVLVFTVSR
jgi:hypothetical protein